MNIKKKCGHVGCRKMIQIKSSYCDEHKKETNKSYNRFRRENHKQYVDFYSNKKWRDMRKSVLLYHDYLCQDCLIKGYYKQADMVDHMIPTRIDWELRLQFDNLRPLCNSCHAKKTVEDKKKWEELR